MDENDAALINRILLIITVIVILVYMVFHTYKHFKKLEYYNSHILLSVIFEDFGFVSAVLFVIKRYEQIRNRNCDGIPEMKLMPEIDSDNLYMFHLKEPVEILCNENCHVTTDTIICESFDMDFNVGKVGKFDVSNIMFVELSFVKLYNTNANFPGENPTVILSFIGNEAILDDITNTETQRNTEVNMR